MDRIFNRARTCVLGLSFFVVATAALAASAPAHDVYEAGGSVRIDAAVVGDVVVAGGRLSFSEAVSEDVIAAGGLVTVAGQTGDDLRVAGGSISIFGHVGGDVIAAGGLVTLEPDSRVDGHARLAGALVDVHGRIDGPLHITGGRVRLGGTVGGDVEIDADSVEIEPGAILRGNLTYAASRSVAVGEGAVVEGEIERIEFAFGEVGSWGPALGRALKSSSMLVLATLAFYLLFPRFSSTVLGRIDDSLSRSLVRGLSILAATPVVVLLLLFSGWATLPALLLLSVYLATLIVSWFIGVLWLGDTVMRVLGRVPDASIWARAASVLLAAAVLLVLGAIPYVGGLLAFAILLLGLGAAGQQLHRRYRG